MSDERISCSLADAAATPSYMNYLETASSKSPSLHVIYINTSLETKAYAHELVPTITCTSSNVMQTILQVENILSFVFILILIYLLAASKMHSRIPWVTILLLNVHIFFALSQAFAQVPELNVWYGPDSYMGANIVELLQQMTKMTDEEIAKIHPKHNRDSIRSLLPRLHYYQVFSKHLLFPVFTLVSPFLLTIGCD